MILVTGVEGLLGARIFELAKDDVVGTYHNPCDIAGNLLRMDITNRKSVFDTVKSYKPEFIIHCAALTDVDMCEIEKEKAWDINVNGTKNIADACKAINAKMVYISTDYIFDGKKGMYQEDDQPNPLSYYAKTKLAGEYEVRKLEAFIIARTSVIYGNGKNNFASWVMQSLKDNLNINVVKDQFNSPTLNTNLAEALLEMCKKDLNGIYNCSGSERISRFNFAKKIADIFELDERLINSIKTEQLKQKAKRPIDSSLDISKIRKEIKIKMLDVKEGLTRMKKETEHSNRRY